MIDFTKILKDIVPDSDGPGEVYRRKMVVAVVNGDNTVDLTSSGVTIPSVPVLAGAQLTVGSNVQVITERGALLVLGKVGAPVAPAVTKPLAHILWGTPNISNGVVTNLTPSSVPVNDGGMWVSGVNFTVPADQGGLYEIGAAIRYAGQATSSQGQRQVRFNVNGANYTYYASMATSLTDTGTPGFAVIRRIMTAGDTISFSAYQVSTITLALDVSSHAWIERVR